MMLLKEKEEEGIIDKSEDIYEILRDDIIINEEEETGLEVYKKEMVDGIRPLVFGLR